MSSDLRIVSVTLTGNAADLIGGALASVVDWVDACLVVDTGVTDATLEIARAVSPTKIVCRQFAWIDDFAAARNFALQAAYEAGFQWGVVLDTDERIDLRGVDVRAVLAATASDVLTVLHDSGAYAKERFFRLPAVGRYAGPTHECYIAAGKRTEHLPCPRFSEVPKTDEEYQKKFQRDVRLLSKHSASNPDDPRWFYYLGDSLQNLGELDQAITMYRSCASLPGWDEQSAWSCYRAAECAIRLGRYDEAVELCGLGLAKHAGVAELCWLAAYASWTDGRLNQAVRWARLSIAAGMFRGDGGAAQRIGFRNLHALYEGPYDVLRFALRALGDETGAAEAERLYSEAAAARLADLNSE